MRVWAFPSFYPYDYPGMSFLGTFAHFQYKGLIEAGVDLKVIVPVEWAPPFPFSHMYKGWKDARKFAYPKMRVYDGVTVYHPRIANMRPGRIFNKPYMERYVETIVNFFSGNKIKLDPTQDIFYSQWLPDSRYVQQAAHKLGVKSAILAIGDDVIVWPKSSAHNYEGFKDLLLHADLRLANADYLMREANNIINEKLPYKIVYFGVDYNLFKPVHTDADRLKLRTKYNIPNDKIVIATVATALVRKGWLDLFDALAEVKKNNNNFVLAAVHAGMKDFEMLDEIRKRGLTDNFVNVGEVPPASLNEIYNAADIFCLPSHWEGLATVVIEAMSSGLPVLTTDICGHPEAIQHGVNGILVQAKQPYAIAQELLSLINDPRKRKELGENARKFIVDKWGSFADNAAKLKVMLEQTLNEK
jgi:glycosyltransferase involved in cell wall biosynthesis